MSISEIREGWYNYTISRVKKLFKRNSERSKIEQMAESRASVCKSCPSLVILTSRLPIAKCKECGCAFPSLVYSKSKKCPTGKWDSAILQDQT